MNKKEVETLANKHGFQILAGLEKIRKEENLDVETLEMLLQYLTTQQTAKQCAEYYTKIIAERYLNEESK